jgi:hypothetical protein
VDFALWFQTMLGGVNKRMMHLVRKAVVAAMYGCWSRNKTAATEFWARVRDEDGDKPSCPDRMIGRWLLTQTLSSKESARGVKVTDRETYVKCLHAWNAWRNNQSTILRYFPDAEVPNIK